jgi:hypothetical protein
MIGTFTVVSFPGMNRHLRKVRTMDWSTTLFPVVSTICTRLTRPLFGLIVRVAIPRRVTPRPVFFEDFTSGDSIWEPFSVGEADCANALLANAESKMKETSRATSL